MLFYDKKGYPVEFKNYEYLDRGNCAKVYIKENVALKVFDCNSKAIMRKDLFQILKYSNLENLIKLYDYYYSFKLFPILRKFIAMDSYTMEYIDEERESLIFASSEYIEKISEQLEVLLQKLSERRIVINDAHYGNIIFGKSGVTIIDPDHFYISNDHSISEIISKNREEAIKYLNDTIENEMYNSNLIDIYNIRLDRYVFIDNIDYSKSLVDIVRNNMGEENISKEYIKKYERYF